ncbi:MAG: tripartite tricarboxylate transporter substrate binding protein [Desulfobacterales bacterium]|nr:tripartite tricarboxylate transporter substrate binding protein [Desulfobacterales bacterium]
MRKLNMLIVLSVIAALAVLSFNVDVHAAKKWPDKPMELLIPTSPGSGASVYTQTVAKLAKKYLDQPMDVLHKPSGNGNDLCRFLMRQPADANSVAIYVGSMTGYMNLPGFESKPTDFVYLMQMFKSLYSLYVHQDSPFKTIEDMIKYAKENPGKLDIGSNKIGSVHFTNVELFAKAAGIKINHVPYKGAGGARKDVMGKHLTAAVAQPYEVLSRSKYLRMLLLFDDKRMPELPDLPVPSDLGYNYDTFYQVYGIMLKKGAPADRLEILKAAFKKVMEEPEFVKLGDKTGNSIVFEDTDVFTQKVLKKTETVREILVELKVIK